MKTSLFERSFYYMKIKVLKSSYMWLKFDNAPKDHLKKHFEVLKHKIPRDSFSTFNLKYSEENNEIVNVLVKIHLQTHFFASPFENYNFIQKKKTSFFRTLYQLKLMGLIRLGQTFRRNR